MPCEAPVMNAMCPARDIGNLRLTRGGSEFEANYKCGVACVGTAVSAVRPGEAGQANSEAGAKSSRAALERTAEGGCPHIGKSPRHTAFTRALGARSGHLGGGRNATA